MVYKYIYISVLLYFNKTNGENSNQSSNTPNTKGKETLQWSVPKNPMDISMIFRNQKRPFSSVGNGPATKNNTEELHPNHSRMNWPMPELLLHHESGTKKRQAQRFLPRKLDSSVPPKPSGRSRKIHMKSNAVTFIGQDGRAS